MSDPGSIQPDPVVTLAARLAEVLDSASFREGLTHAEAAALCGVSRSKWAEMYSRGQTPLPIELGDGKCLRFLRSELLAWMRSGAISRSRWLQVREQAMRRLAG